MTKEKLVYEMLGYSNPEISRFLNHIDTNCRDINEAGFLSFGYFFVNSIEGVVVKVIDEYLKIFDKVLSLGDFDYQEKEKLARSQGAVVSYKKFLFLFKSQSKDELDYSHPFYNQDFQLFLRRNYQPTLKGYLEYVKESDFHLKSFFNRSLPYYLRINTLKQHAVITAGSGFGKSELLKQISFNLLKLKNFCSLVLIDPHRDFAHEVAMFKENAINPDRLVYLDVGLKDGYTFTINPFFVPRRIKRNPKLMKEYVISQSQELLSTLEQIVIMESPTAELSSLMKIVLLPAITTLLYREGSTLKDLANFMNDKRNSDLVKLGCENPIEEHAEFMKFSFLDKNYTRSKQAVFNRIMSLLTFETFKNLTCGDNTIDLEELVNSKKLVVISLGKGDIGESASIAMGSLIVGLLFGIATRRSKIPKNQRIPLIACVDESQNYLTPSVKKILEEARKYSTHLILCMQRLGQNMSTSLLNDILANSACKITGNNSDPQTLSLISKISRISSEDITSLKLGEFWIRSSGSKAVKVTIPDFLVGNKNSMTAKQWEEIKKQQIAKYYRPTDPSLGSGQVYLSEINPDEFPTKEDSIVTQQSTQKLTPKFEE